MAIFEGCGAIGTISLILSTTVWPYSSVKCQPVFFIEVVSGIDEIVVGSVADSLKEVIYHKVQTPKIFDAMDISADLPPPIIEPLSKLLVVFIGSVVFYRYLRSA